MVKKKEARQYLSDVSSDKYFCVISGPILKNLEDLANTLPKMSDDQFRHHVNESKNDFSIWAREVIGDQKLANDLMSATNKDSALLKVMNRLNSLKSKLL